MAHRIQLEQDHQDLIEQALIRSLEHKRNHVVRSQAKLAETERQYRDALDKFRQPVVCGTLGKNIFTWLADQIRHSGPLRDLELGRRVLDLCDVCSRNRYDDYIADRGAHARLEAMFELQ